MKTAYWSSLLFMLVAAQGLDVLTWNVGLEEQWADERVPGILQALSTSSADVLGLTEVWGGPIRLDVFTHALKGRYPYSIRAPMPVLSHPCNNLDDLLECLVTHACVPRSDSWMGCFLGCVQAERQIDGWQADPCWACVIEQGYRLYARQASVQMAFAACTDATPWSQTLGLLVLSRVPVHLVSWGMYASFLIPRGYLTVAVGGVNVTCTHLTVPGLPFPYVSGMGTPWHSYAEENYRQTLALLSVVNDSQVIMGDFNHGPAVAEQNVSAVNAEAYNLIGAAGWYDCYRGGCTACRDNNVSPTNPPAIYDHIWTREPCGNGSRIVRMYDQGLTVTSGGRCVRTRLSDHYGLLRTTRYVPPPGSDTDLCLSVGHRVGYPHYFLFVSMFGLLVRLW